MNVMIIDGEKKIGLNEWNMEYEIMNEILQIEQNKAKEITNLNENNEMESVTTLALGSRPKQGLTKARAKREAQESHFMLPKMQKSVREWTLTLPSELPLWELESRWTPKFLGSDYRGQKPIGLKSSLYHLKFIEI